MQFNFSKYQWYLTLLCYFANGLSSVCIVQNKDFSQSTGMGNWENAIKENNNSIIYLVNSSIQRLTIHNCHYSKYLKWNFSDNFLKLPVKCVSIRMIFALFVVYNCIEIHMEGFEESSKIIENEKLNLELNRVIRIIHLYPISHVANLNNLKFVSNNRSRISFTS